MKPYAPLGLLYISAYLKRAGFDVETFDTTFSDREALVARLAATPGGVVGVYTNLMTRANRDLDRRAGPPPSLDRDLRRSRERQLSRRLHRRAAPMSWSLGEGREHARGVAAGPARPRPAPIARGRRNRLPRRGRSGRAQRPARQGPRHRLPAVARSRSHRHAAVRRHVANASRDGLGQPHHRSRLPVQVQLVQSCRVRVLAPPARPDRLRRRGAAHRRAVSARTGLVRRRRVHDQPQVAVRVRATR